MSIPHIQCQVRSSTRSWQGFLAYAGWWSGHQTGLRRRRSYPLRSRDIGSAGACNDAGANSPDPPEPHTPGKSPSGLLLSDIPATPCIN
jgi:hypothetical protein